MSATDDFRIDLDLKTETLTNALKQKNDAINNPMQGAGDTQRITQLNRLVNNLVNQQNIYLRAAESSGRIHTSKMQEWDRYFEGVASNMRLRASLRQESGSRGGTPFSDMLEELSCVAYSISNDNLPVFPDSQPP